MKKTSICKCKLTQRDDCWWFVLLLLELKVLVFRMIRFVNFSGRSTSVCDDEIISMVPKEVEVWRQLSDRQCLNPNQWSHRLVHWFWRSVERIQAAKTELTLSAQCVLLGSVVFRSSNGMPLPCLSVLILMNTAQIMELDMATICNQHIVSFQVAVSPTAYMQKKAK